MTEQPIAIDVYDRSTRSIVRLVERTRWVVAGVVVVRLVDVRTGRAPRAPYFELRGRTRHATHAAALFAAQGRP